MARRYSLPVNRCCMFNDNSPPDPDIITSSISSDVVTCLPLHTLPHIITLGSILCRNIPGRRPKYFKIIDIIDNVLYVEALPVSPRIIKGNTIMIPNDSKKNLKLYPPDTEGKGKSVIMIKINETSALYHDDLYHIIDLKEIHTPRLMG